MSANTLSKEQDASGGLVYLGVALLTTPLRGWALNILWGWFFTPLFKIAAPGLWWCAGLSLFLNYLICSRAVKKGQEIDYAGTCSVLIVGPLIVLAFGWILHQIVR